VQVLYPIFKLGRIMKNLLLAISITVSLVGCGGSETSNSADPVSSLKENNAVKISEDNNQTELAKINNPKPQLNVYTSNALKSLRNYIDTDFNRLCYYNNASVKTIAKLTECPKSN